MVSFKYAKILARLEHLCSGHKQYDEKHLQFLLRHADTFSFNISEQNGKNADQLTLGEC